MSVNNESPERDSNLRPAHYECIAPPGQKPATSGACESGEASKLTFARKGPGEWSPDGHNCRSCGSHEYAFWVNDDGTLVADREAYAPPCATSGCPLNRPRPSATDRLIKVLTDIEAAELLAALELGEVPVVRDDAVSYEHDYREVQGPVCLRVAPADSGAFFAGFCPRCFCRLSWNRTLCFADERDDECSECRIAWKATP